MKEISLHILDVAQNSIAIGATELELSLTENEAQCLTVTISDNGCGMSAGFLKTVTDPFTTTRTARQVGLGLPFLMMSAEQTGGKLRVESQAGIGTTVTTTFFLRHIDCPPLGDIGGTVAALTQSSPNLNLKYVHTTPLGSFYFSSEEARNVLGADVSLDEPSVTLWIRDYINEHETLL
jgi:hypothetical protein